MSQNKHLSSSSEFQDTWEAFLRALRSTNEAFEPFSWIYLLVRAATADAWHRTRCPDVCNRFQLQKVWRPIIPIFGIFLIFSIVLSYFLCLRYYLFKERWCCSTPRNETKDGDSLVLSQKCMEEFCFWISFHDFLVSYLATMILFHYLRANFLSPGVALPISTATRSTMKWKAIDSQGGLLFFNPSLDEASERNRVSLYGCLRDPSSSAQNQSANNVTTQQQQPAATTKAADLGSVYPCPDATFCNKCQIVRPPRCHHCSICNRCVLQFDHHCVWLNNCIGYNNYRPFFLTLVFIVLGCWYGVIILSVPFYELIRVQIQQQGWHWMYSNGTGILNLPSPKILLRLIFTGQASVNIIVAVVFPFLLLVGMVMTGFLGYHIKYILKGRSSLEHRVIILDQLRELVSTSVSSSRRPDLQVPINPFDQGYCRNLLQVLGPHPFLIFLPLPISPPPPFVPFSSLDISALEKNKRK